MTLTAPAETSYWDGVVSWLETAVPERWRTHRASLTTQEETAIRREWDRQLHVAGYSMLSLPQAYGGQGLGLAEEVTFHELAARAHAPDGLARIGKILAAPALIAHGTDEQRERFLPRIVSGEDVWCQGFSEPGSGSDLASVQCLARKVEGGWRITGQKVWTSYAEDSHRCLMVVVTDPAAGRYKNLSLLLMDMAQPGITIRTIKQVSGSMHFAEMFLDDVLVEDRDVLGDLGDGWKVAMQSIAQQAVEKYGGKLPSDQATLLSFKGIGEYTAGAIRSFAFRERAAILDTNVARVLFRIFVGKGDPKSHTMKKRLWALSASVLPHKHVFDFNQALMDFGATHCSARKPKCASCSMKGFCRSRKLVM